jgi:hypothetical protein
VPEHPLVGVVRTPDLPGLDASYIAGVARDLLADLTGGPADRRRELAR